jgi:hypothetical protein
VPQEQFFDSKVSASRTRKDVYLEPRPAAGVPSAFNSGSFHGLEVMEGSRRLFADLQYNMIWDFGVAHRGFPNPEPNSRV